MTATPRVRRPPPPFRPVTVAGAEALGPRMRRVTLTGPALDGLAVAQPAASVRLLLPSAGSDELVMPTWEGNEFLLPDGSRPVIRTLTPRHRTGDRLDVDVVLHGGGALSDWAESAPVGAPAAVSGPGRGYDVDPDAPAYLLAGDETALPAIAQLLETIPATTPVGVIVEVARPEGRLDLPDHQGAEVTWLDLDPGASPGDALAVAVTAATIVPGTRVWVAGEAAAVQRIRTHLFDERGLDRRATTVRGYWKRT